MVLWQIIIITIILLGLILCFIKLIKIKLWKESYWIIWYILSVFISVFILFCFYIDFFIIDFLRDFGLRFSIRDPQDYLNLKMDFIIYYSLFFTLFLGLLFVWIYFLNYLSIFLKSFWYVWFVSMVIYYLGINFIIQYDLFFSNWPDIKALKKLITTYNLTPDISMLISVYYSEWLDLIDFFSIFLINFIFQKFLIRVSLSNLKKQNIVNKFFLVSKIQNLNWYKQVFVLLILIFVFFIFGGESLWRDFMLIILVFISLEFLFFTSIFFYCLNFFKVKV